MNNNRNLKFIFIMIEVVFMMVFFYEETRFSTALLICTIIALTYFCLALIMDVEEEIQDEIDDEFNIDE